VAIYANTYPGTIAFDRFTARVPTRQEISEAQQMATITP
jgi:hypothetical protein